MRADKGGGVGNIDRLSRASIFIAGYCPNGFVCDDDLMDIFFANVVEAANKLIVDSGFSFAVFAFFSGFADAEDRGNSVAERGGDFFANIAIRFVEKITTLGVSDEGVIDKATNLAGGSFASKSTGVAPIDILGGKLHLTAVNLK